MSKSVYVLVFHDLDLLRYVLRCAVERQLSFPAGMNKVYSDSSYIVTTRMTPALKRREPF